MRNLFLLLVLSTSLATAEDWPMAAGPHANYVMEGEAPARFSVSRNEGVLWRSPLPNTGQSAPIVSKGRIFVASHAPISADTETGSTILGLCFDAKTGKELWRRELPAARTTDLSSLFSDNTAAAPVADGTRVCFVNVGGRITCFDYEGVEQWSYAWVPFGRHHARQHQPILHRGQVILMQVPRQDLDPKVTTKAGAKPLGRAKEYWTRLQGFDLETGQRRWVAECGSSVHAASMIGRTSGGITALLTGRGGGHQPPEEPYGLSLVRADNGKTLWDLPVKGYAAMQNVVWTPERACCFAGREHVSVDIATGKVLGRSSLVEDVSLTAFENGRYVHQSGQTLSKVKKPLTYFTNVLAGDYHWFRAHHGFLVGRVHIPTGMVEYLQVPVQVLHENGKTKRSWTTALVNDMKNSGGFLATQDKRNAGSGWGHVSAAASIVVGERIYMPTMVGTVYVLKRNAVRLDEHALESISDLGPAGETWCLANLSFADGRLYARTLKELVCIGR